jgi:hypothetical protein
MNELFHGNKDVLSHIDMAVKGFGPYKRLLEKSVNYVTDDTDTNPTHLVVSRSIFLLDKDYVVGRHLTKLSLKNKTMNLLWHSDIRPTVA